MKPPTISVLTPAYNAQAYLRELIESVLAQDYPHVEHIVIDDGSTDGTAAILATYPHLKWVTQPNKGQYATQNDLFDMASGDIVVVICADDFFVASDVFSTVAKRFSADEELDGVLGRTIRKVEGWREYLVRPDAPTFLTWRLLPYYCSVHHCSFFVRRSLLERHGIRFDPSFRCRGDWDWLQQLHQEARKVEHVRKDFACWRQHPVQTSRTQMEKHRIETENILSRNEADRRVHRLAKTALTFYGKAAHALAILAQCGPRTLFARKPAPSSSEDRKLCVMACVDYYLPGYKGGGPAVSVSRMAERLSQEVEFCVFSRDRDLGDDTPYPDVPLGEWFERGGIRYFYAPPQKLGPAGLLRAMNAIRPDVVYLNSYFSRITRSALVLRVLGLTKKASFLIAPRGEFSPGALQLKAAKKRVYLRLLGALGQHKNLTWQVSSIHEMRDTKAVIEERATCFVKAPDLMDVTVDPVAQTSLPKQPGEAQFTFISRLSPKKNLLGAIEMLRDVKGKATFTIYGPIEDLNYWASCEKAMSSLPDGVACLHEGPIPPAEVCSKLSQHHFFLFPTLGENFGHVIPEALSAGCPTLLSDQTPWQDLGDRGAGWVMPLEDRAAWVRAIQDCIDMDEETYCAMRQAAQGYVCELAKSSTDLEKSREMFHAAVAKAKAKAA